MRIERAAFDGRCPVCVEGGTRSVVTPDTLFTQTLMASGAGFYDEDGKYHSPEPMNTATQGHRCDRGHEFIVTWKVP